MKLWLDILRATLALLLVFYASGKWILTNDPVWFVAALVALILEELVCNE